MLCNNLQALTVILSFFSDLKHAIICLLKSIYMKGLYMNLDKLQQWLQASNNDLAYISNPTTISYFTGYSMDPHERIFSLIVFKDKDRSIIYIPNRNISVVQNLAHGGIALNIDLELDANNNFEEVNNLIKRTNSIIQPEKNAIVSGPSITGITKQTDKAVTFSVHFQVNPGKEGSIRNLYLTSYIQILQENNIVFANTTNINKFNDSKIKKL